MATLQSGKCFTVPTFFGMCCRSEWQERMYIYKWHEVDLTNMKYFVHIVCNEIQVEVNLEITTFFFYLRFPYCPNFFWFGVVFIITYITLEKFREVKLILLFSKYALNLSKVTVKSFKKKKIILKTFYFFFLTFYYQNPEKNPEKLYSVSTKILNSPTTDFNIDIQH